MLVSIDEVHSSVMAKREEPSKQINIRLKLSLIAEVDAIRRSGEFEPTMTQVVELAIKDWLAKKQAAARDKKR